MNNINRIEETYDVIIVGAGHAGCEAALASARLGLETIVFTVSVDSIAMMPCNPNIGGTSKGHLVCELDALGGEMGKCIDRTYIQSKMLNQSKGPAVHSLRAQADKQAYSAAMRQTLENTEHLTIRQGEVTELLTEAVSACRETEEARSSSRFEEEPPEQTENRFNAKVLGVKTSSGACYFAKAVVLCTGVYLNARCIYGEVEEFTGPNGLRSATGLTDSLIKNGIGIRRFKTGTPARVDARSIDFSKLEVQKGDPLVRPFSFSNEPEDIAREQVNCWLSYTNEETHELIRQNIDRSPLFSGAIRGTGPRYCPSIEDKVVKFPEKERHQIFVEPEGLYTNEMYLSGMSSSLPEDVQLRMIRTMKGFENARIVRNAYAIEYDLIDATILRPSLEFKSIEGLYGAGQLNGSSGYEEAAVQGFMAGVNAARKIKGLEPVILDRSQAYIGVLIDDLVTKESSEPYRMMTSRAEYRLLLRQDNADLRLRETGYEIGLVSEAEYRAFLTYREQIEKEIRRLESTYCGAVPSVNHYLEGLGSSGLPDGKGSSLAELMKRPELSYELLRELDPDRPELSWRVREEVNIEIKYKGYIDRQRKQVEQFLKLENRKIPEGTDYLSMQGLRLEARQKLDRIRPESIGQAGRISGVSPADISVLLVYLEQKARMRHHS